MPVKHLNKLSPSILASNQANLLEGLRTVENEGLSWIHLDIMDGHFVPNLTFGPQAVADLRKDSKLYFDTHLMLDNPHLFIEPFVKAGANNITIHVEPNYPIAETLQHIRDLGCHCGIALNPGTPIDSVEPYIDQVDIVLVMTVQPGFGGQSFRPAMLEKIKILNDWRTQRALNYRIEVDGGINLETGKQCLEAGTDTFVIGTAFYRENDKSHYIGCFEAIDPLK